MCLYGWRERYDTWSKFLTTSALLFLAHSEDEDAENPLFVFQVVDLKICMYDRLYQDAILVNNRYSYIVLWRSLETNIVANIFDLSFFALNPGAFK